MHDSPPLFDLEKAYETTNMASLETFTGLASEADYLFLCQNI